MSHLTIIFTSCSYTLYDLILIPKKWIAPVAPDSLWHKPLAWFWLHVALRFFEKCTLAQGWLWTKPGEAEPPWFAAIYIGVAYHNCYAFAVVIRVILQNLAWFHCRYQPILLEQKPELAQSTEKLAVFLFPSSFRKRWKGHKCGSKADAACVPTAQHVHRPPFYPKSTFKKAYTCLIPN